MAENLLILPKPTEQRVSVVVRHAMRYLCQVRAARSKTRRIGYDLAERYSPGCGRGQWILAKIAQQQRSI